MQNEKPVATPRERAELAPRPDESVVVSLVRVAGWAAYRAGEGRAPALNPVVMKALEGHPVGGEPGAAIMRAFAEGYDLAAEQDAERAAQVALALADDGPLCAPGRRLDHGHTVACGPMRGELAEDQPEN